MAIACQYGPSEPTPESYTPAQLEYAYCPDDTSQWGKHGINPLKMWCELDDGGGFSGPYREWWPSATVKGTLIVAIVQGALGGLIFWILRIHAPILWAAVMAVFSLLPAVGAAVVWLPVAIYLLVTGSTWQGLLLIAWGVLVIGLIDNILRPILVGKEARMPDYVVLISTVGGIAMFGINGLVIGPLIAAMFIAVWDILYRSRTASKLEISTV